MPTTISLNTTYLTEIFQQIQDHLKSSDEAQFNDQNGLPSILRKISISISQILNKIKIINFSFTIPNSLTVNVSVFDKQQIAFLKYLLLTFITDKNTTDPVRFNIYKNVSDLYDSIHMLLLYINGQECIRTVSMKYAESPNMLSSVNNNELYSIAAKVDLLSGCSIPILRELCSTILTECFVFDRLSISLIHNKSQKLSIVRTYSSIMASLKEDIEWLQQTIMSYDPRYQEVLNIIVKLRTIIDTTIKDVPLKRLNVSITSEVLTQKKKTIDKQVMIRPLPDSDIEILNDLQHEIEKARKYFTKHFPRNVNEKLDTIILHINDCRKKYDIKKRESSRCYPFREANLLIHLNLWISTLENHYANLSIHDDLVLIKKLISEAINCFQQFKITLTTPVIEKEISKENQYSAFASIYFETMIIFEIYCEPMTRKNQECDDISKKILKSLQQGYETIPDPLKKSHKREFTRNSLSKTKIASFINKHIDDFKNHPFKSKGLQLLISNIEKFLGLINAVSK